MKVRLLLVGFSYVSQQALSNHSISDFLIVEYQDQIGGRVHAEKFGVGLNGQPLIVEYGANWIQGLGTPGHQENPIWTFVSPGSLARSLSTPLRFREQEKKWNISNHFSDYEKILTYNESGPVDFTTEIEAFENYTAKMAAEAGEILTDNLQDRTIREGLSIVGWKPTQRDYPAAASAVEWWLYGKYFIH